jgi:hypothetical protein
MARACIAVNRTLYLLRILGKDDAIAALKQSVTLDNPSDWYYFLLIIGNCLLS